jgi:predicted transposase YbfD/YdcC
MLTEKTRTSALEYFAKAPDPRRRVLSCMYPMHELMFVALCGVLSGADGWVGVVQWANLRLDWLQKQLPFTNGVASHDTFSRIFGLLSSACFEACFINWMQEICPNLAQKVIPIDGKSLRGSHDGEQRMAHLVSAWNTEQGLVLAQVKTSAKSNEITAIPELLSTMDIQGSIITIDAMGCQHGVVEKILDKQADYIIGVKNNQPLLAQAIERLFDAQPVDALEHTTVEKNHGRLETRHCMVSANMLELGLLADNWAGLQSVIRIDSTREVINGKSKGATSQERRYYISSLKFDAGQFNAAIRAHWSIENSCHWLLDMTFSEDDCRIRVANGAQNFAILRRISLNLLAQEKSDKTSMNIKRQKAGWSPDYLAKLLGFLPQT